MAPLLPPYTRVETGEAPLPGVAPRRGRLCESIFLITVFNFAFPSNTTSLHQSQTIVIDLFDFLFHSDCRQIRSPRAELCSMFDLPLAPN